MCDATGDCNFDLQVTVDELLIMIEIALGNQPIWNCHQGDASGDRQITVDEITKATDLSLNADAHDGTLTGAPSFQADGRHLIAGMSGSNVGLAPSSFGVPVCRAGCCDADSHKRPEPQGGAYDIGAYEDSGTQAKDNTCLNAAPGQCVTSCSAMASAAFAAAPSVALEIGSVTACSGEFVDVPITMSGSDGSAAGLQLDVLYDPAVLRVADPAQACAITIPGYGGTAYTNLPGRGRLRVILVDIHGRGTFGDGTLVACRFQVRGGVAGRYPLAVEKYMVSAGAGKVLDTSVGVGEVEVGESCAAATLGDG